VLTRLPPLLLLLRCRLLELRCPALLMLHAAACQAVPRRQLTTSVEGCGRLQLLDVSHTQHSQADLAQLQGGLPAASQLLTCQQHSGACSVCRRQA
jgi:hypothetical protein